MGYNSDALSKLADDLLGRKSSYDKLKEIGNRSNYSHKIQKLKDRLTSEYKFWLPKGPSNRLTDIEKDIAFIKTVQDKKELTGEEKSRINQLSSKYPID